MSRELLANRLMDEVYAAIYQGRPMDPRRIKRMCNLTQKTSWNDTETVNKLGGAFLCSTAARKGRK